ncbi:hypothetical protein [Chenggangzhangella methanolivorans]|uniref:Uncharacterized protein n=1 Tax=Chenggangzhangella methanolivorans TaxID=1437009 RepID=A0A9E6UI84_9HYPH|nr:hypothetical protein [Chenggangzhangella methanolivorans]QZO00558.1 hypothetical protein K6K41_02175 [Chenggangzhangella methanolivorans]
MLATWLTAKIVEALKVQKDGELAQSLYRTIDNTLRALVTTLAARGGKLEGLPAGLINDAIEIVKRATIPRRSRRSSRATTRSAPRSSPSCRACRTTW